MAINIQNIIAALEAKVAAATSATETQELIVLIKTIKASGQSIIASYATSSALPTATSANAGNIAFVSDVAKLFYSNGTTWAEVGSGSGGGTAYDQSLNTTDDVVFNSALIGSIALIDNTLSAVDVYGNLDKLTISSPLEITSGGVATTTTHYSGISYVTYNGTVMGTGSTLTIAFDTAALNATQRQELATQLTTTYLVAGKTVTTAAMISAMSYQNEILSFTVNSASIATDPYNSASVTGVIVNIGSLTAAGSTYPLTFGSWNLQPSTTFALTAELSTLVVAATVNQTGISTIKPLLVEGDFAANKTVVTNGAGQVPFSMPISAIWSSYQLITSGGYDNIQINVSYLSASDKTALLALPAGTNILFATIYLNGWTSPTTLGVTLAITPSLVSDYYGSQYIQLSFVEKDMFNMGQGGPLQANANIESFFNYTYTKTDVTKLIDVTSDVLSVGGIKVNSTTPINAGALVVGGEVQPQALNVYNKVTTETATTTYNNSAPGTAGTIDYLSVNISFMGVPNAYYETPNPNNIQFIPAKFFAGDILKLEFTRYSMMLMKQVKWVINAVVASEQRASYGGGEYVYVLFNTTASITYSDDGGATYKSGTMYDLQMQMNDQFSSMSANDLKATYIKVDTYNPLLVNNSGVLATNVVSDSALIGDVTVVGNTISAVDSYGLPNGKLTVQSNVVLEKDVTFGGTTVTSVSSSVPSKYLQVYAKSMANLSMTTPNWINIYPQNMGPGDYYISFTFDNMYGTVKDNAEVTAVKSLKPGNTITAGGYYGSQTFTVMAVTLTTTSVLVKINNSASFNFNMGDAVSISYLAETPYYLPLYTI